MRTSGLESVVDNPVVRLLFLRAVVHEQVAFGIAVEGVDRHRDIASVHTGQIVVADQRLCDVAVDIVARLCWPIRWR